MKEKKETPNTSLVSFKFCKSALELNSDQGKNHVRVSVLSTEPALHRFEFKGKKQNHLLK